MKVFVVCPAMTKTGGTELAHQLVKKLNELCVHASIAYPKNKDGEYINDAFRKYVNTYSLIEEIEDSAESIVVIPEGMTNVIKRFVNAKLYVWWMSVDNYFYPPKFKYAYQNGGIKNIFKELVRRLLRYGYKESKCVPIRKMGNVSRHLVQSHYAYDFLIKNHVPSEKVSSLSDYINDDYIKNASTIDLKQKENIVLYNPKKGYKFTKKMISLFKDINFVPIKNMSNSQVVELMKKSKVYIDFGCHPGKDRIPREAAMMYCCVLTGKNGSARYYEDVMINESLKFGETKTEIQRLRAVIDSIFSNYDEYIKKYEDYRKRISEEKMIFENEVKSIFLYNGEQGE